MAQYRRRAGAVRYGGGAVHTSAMMPEFVPDVMMVDAYVMIGWRWNDGVTCGGMNEEDACVPSGVGGPGDASPHCLEATVILRQRATSERQAQRRRACPVTAKENRRDLVEG